MCVCVCVCVYVCECVSDVCVCVCVCGGCLVFLLLLFFVRVTFMIISAEAKICYFCQPCFYRPQGGLMNWSLSLNENVVAIGSFPF